LGEIGREVALRAAAFGMSVVYHQRTALAAEEALHWNARYCTLEELLEASDVVFVTLPGNDSTRNLLGTAQLARMKRGALLINVSRAAIVERTALLDALQSGRIGGLGLDTFYEEPGRPDDPLLAVPNAIITPRVAAQPRSNALGDLADVMANLASVLGRS
jgi:glyoxylate reductase